MFEPDKYYKHRGFKDVCFKVHTWLEVNTIGDCALSVSWHLVRRNRLVPMGITDTLQIRKNDRQHYKVLKCIDFSSSES